jgi:hypothetical protein
MVEELAILRNNTLDKQLAREGYVIIPFLNKQEVTELKDFFYHNHQHEIPGFYATAHHPDIAFRKKMNDTIKRVFQSSIEKHFTGCEALGGSFVVKTRSQEERLHPHQDWNIVDETVYRSFNIWTPLVDLSKENGAIRILPKSHLWGLNYRGPNIPDTRADQLESFWQDMLTLNMKAGEALIYDHRLYHASYANKTDEYRLATVFGIKPESAAMYYYYGNNGNIDVYESSVNFFMEADIQQGPSVLKKVNTILGETQDNKKTNPGKNKSLWSKLKSLFLSQ